MNNIFQSTACNPLMSMASRFFKKYKRIEQKNNKKVRGHLSKIKCCLNFTHVHTHTNTQEESECNTQCNFYSKYWPTSLKHSRTQILLSQKTLRTPLTVYGNSLSPAIFSYHEDSLACQTDLGLNFTLSTKYNSLVFE